VWSSVASHLVGRVASGFDRAAQKAGHCREFFLVQPRTDIGEPSLHPRIVPTYFGPAVTHDAENHTSTVRWVAVTRDPAPALKAIDDACERGRMDGGSAGKRCGTHRSQAFDELEALKVACPEIELVPHSQVEQSELGTQVAKRHSNRERQALASGWRFGLARRHRFHIIWKQ
jgi:hypothetical protein